MFWTGELLSVSLTCFLVYGSGSIFGIRILKVAETNPILKKETTHHEVIDWLHHFSHLSLHFFDYINHNKYIDNQRKKRSWIIGLYWLSIPIEEEDWWGLRRRGNTKYIIISCLEYQYSVLYIMYRYSVH